MMYDAIIVGARRAGSPTAVLLARRGFKALLVDKATLPSDTILKGRVMFVVREIVHCKPGKVRQVVEKFRAMCPVMKDMGYEPFRLLTDVSGEPFWTVVAEAKVDEIDDFFAMQQKVMASEMVRAILADHHDLVDGGRREIYRIEN